MHVSDVTIQHRLATQHVTAVFTFIRPPFEMNGVNMPGDISASPKPLPAAVFGTFEPPLTVVNRSDVTDNGRGLVKQY